MDRRRFLNFLILSASAPAVLSSCRGSDSALSDLPEDGSLDPLFSAWRRAQSLQKALLVIPVPEDPRLAAAHARRLGYFFNHCDDEALFDLAHTEVVAAEARDVSRLLDDRAALERLQNGAVPMMWLLRTDSEPLQAQEIGTSLPPLYEFGWHTGDNWETQKRKFHDSLTECNAALALSLREVLWTSGDSRTRASIGTKRASAIDEARASLRDAPPAGTVWANSTGCGCEIEGENGKREAISVACGMAMIPSEASRFLQFYTAS